MFYIFYNDKEHGFEGCEGAYLMETGHAIIIYQPGVGPMGEQKPCDLRVPTVAGPVQSGGTPTSLGVTLGPTFQQELAYCVVSIAAGIVLQGTETEVGQRNQAGDRARGAESVGPRAEASLHQLCDLGNGLHVWHQFPLSFLPHGIVMKMKLNNLF